MSGIEKEIESAILELLNSRKPDASICPSEVARLVFGEDWREQMPKVREVANEMAKQKRIEICQKGVVVDLSAAKGPVRLRIFRNQNT